MNQIAHSGARSIADLLEQFTPSTQSSLATEIQQAIFLAGVLQSRAAELQTPHEQRQQAELDRMIDSPADKATLVQITDQAFRSKASYRVADQLTHILDVQGVPRFFSPWDRALLRGFQTFGGFLPGVAVPLVKEKLHHETANVVLPAEPDFLSRHLDRRHAEGLRMNVNLLGEALLGEAEAERRMRAYRDALKRPEIEVISVKISTIDSQIWPLAREHTIQRLCDRIETIYRAAADEVFIRNDGDRRPKFVYLDMEEYRDMSLTAEAFMKTLDRPGLENVAAGIALQAYIPDSYATQKSINAWARARRANGGSPVTIRLVKGANLEMERVEASLRGWPQSPFHHKRETDANFKRMLREAMVPENLHAVRIGVASHNLFDVAYALVLTHHANAFDSVQFEMLEGMANHQRRALFEMASNVLLYAPACKQEDFLHAIGYLIRRLDENTGPDNFLRHTFKLKPGSEQWHALQQKFIESFDIIDRLDVVPRRTQNRSTDAAGEPRLDAVESTFRNEPDTDFCLPANSDWAEQIVQRWLDRHGDQATCVPLVIDGHETDNGSTCYSSDPSRPALNVCRYIEADDHAIDQAVDCARRDQDGWRSLPAAQRTEILRGAADEIARNRGDLMGAALADAGKTLAESDPEVSEAIDFARFYARTAEQFQTTMGATTPRGVVAVVAPWNFPIAIPCGGVAAALAAGNTVILKPSSDSVLPAYLLCQCFWRAGVSTRALQFVPCAGGGAGQRLVTHDQVDVVILTGGTETALRMLKAKPDMRLLAETGGKNATIVTALADRDLAIKNVLHSAFSHSGQKCSATSLLILEDEVYDDRRFRDALCDAAASLSVGSAWQLKNRIGPLIRPASGPLKRAIDNLERGESWALPPRLSYDNPRIVSPGIKWDVKPGGFTHMTELFGPVLGVMRARNLEDAVDIVNQTGYGLTSGLETLDDREQSYWREHIRAGNLYINRPTTGAIVLRQPFGGIGKSAIGPGIKAGGPNYVTQLMSFTQSDIPSRESPTSSELRRFVQAATALVDRDWITADDLARVTAALCNYESAMDSEFSLEHDSFRLVGQDNIRRYLPAKEMRIRIDPRDTTFEILARIGAAILVGCRVTISHFPSHETDANSRIVGALHDVAVDWGSSMEVAEESDDRLAAVLRNRHADRVRYASPKRVPEVIRKATAENGLYIADANVLSLGRIELLWYLQEQSISIDYHRYGNLGIRASEDRAPVE